MFSIYEFQDICSTLSKMEKARSRFIFRGLYALQQVMYRFNMQKDSIYSLNLELYHEQGYMVAHMIDEVMKYREVDNAEVDINFYFHLREFKIEYALVLDRYDNKFMDRHEINFHNMEQEFYEMIDYVINRDNRPADDTTATSSTPDYYPLHKEIWTETAIQYFAKTQYEGASKYSMKEYFKSTPIMQK